MPVNELVKVLNEDVKKEIESIISNAQEERNRIINASKSQIDEEFESKKNEVLADFEKSLSLQKLSIESENRRMVNEKLSAVFDELYKEIVDEVKRMLVSLKEKENFILSILEKVVDNLPEGLNRNDIEVILSRSDFESFSRKVESLLNNKGIHARVVGGDIDGGVVVRVGKLSIDNSLDKIIDMFRPSIVNLIYKNLPNVGY